MRCVVKRDSIVLDFVAQWSRHKIPAQLMPLPKAKPSCSVQKNISLACWALKFMYSPCPFSGHPTEVTS